MGKGLWRMIDAKYRLIEGGKGSRGTENQKVTQERAESSRASRAKRHESNKAWGSGRRRKIRGGGAVKTISVMTRLGSGR